MRSVIFASAMLTCSASALAATAMFTGRSEYVQTVTYKWVWKCEYSYLGRTFTRLFPTSCPATVEVE